MSEINKDKIKHIAHLARIGIDDEQAEKYAKQMNGILDYMKILEEVDTSNVKMTTQVTGLKSVMRSDEVKQYSSPDDLLDCSVLSKLNHSIVVKAIIKE
ncbi:Asp-tRNA(Asn)/Glu-tRNA(Gln) amidotransferase subunit GatC [Candidatus Peregrinibacteria bacterium]|nr:Asp-tRNA(Asn)/Glu-tRNA(Gln) amidotransferase subunit GatC [Candidatus Peregrinibacteria bacterium]